MGFRLDGPAHTICILDYKKYKWIKTTIFDSAER